MRPHRALQRALASCIKAADGHADLEREDPSLAKWDPRKQEWQQGKVDLWCSFPGVPMAFLLDVTIRSFILSILGRWPQMASKVHSHGPL